jgi:hypothetical protein
LRREPFGKTVEELGRRRGIGGGPNFVITRVGATVTNIVPGIRPENHRILGYQPNVGAKIARIETDILKAVERHVPV